MEDWARFGDRSRFEIALRWVDDPEPRGRRPAHGGWSTGQLRLTVNHHVVTRTETASGSSDGLTWYLLPVFEWLAENWVHLLHEERFAWRENGSAPAATAAFLALRRAIDLDDSVPGGESFDAVQAWRARHALPAADASALLPEVVFRRLRDEVEISWIARQPSYPPDGFRFALMPGVATLPVAAVAAPLWEALHWIGATARPRKLLRTREDAESVERLERRLRSLEALPTADLEADYLPHKLFAALARSRDRARLGDTSRRLKAVPALDTLDDAVLMFGGVSPEIGQADANTLVQFLASRQGQADGADLLALVDSSVGAPAGVPFQEGYDRAERLLDACALPGDSTQVDIRALLEGWGVEIVEKALKTNTIRGVAVAGARYAPAVLVNETSDYNASEAGRRFTLAHELFHILYDRSRAQRVTHVSGPWAPPGVEKRANAFAAMLLMPRTLLARHFRRGAIDEEAVASAATELNVGLSALVEHLYNISMIDEPTRDRLRGLDVGTRARTASRSRRAPRGRRI